MRSNKACAPQLLSLCSRAQELQLMKPTSSPCSTTTEVTAMRGPLTAIKGKLAHQQRPYRTRNKYVFKIYVLLWLVFTLFPVVYQLRAETIHFYSFLYFKTMFTKAFYTIIFTGKYLWNKCWKSKSALIRKRASSDLIPPPPPNLPLLRISLVSSGVWETQ